MSRVLEMELGVAATRKKAVKWIQEYVQRVRRDEEDAQGIDLSECSTTLTWDELNDQESVLVQLILEDGVVLMWPEGTTEKQEWGTIGLDRLMGILRAAEEYMIEKGHMERPNWIPATKCKDRHIYLLRARNIRYGVFRKDRMDFEGIRHKFGDVFLDSEGHYDTGDGSARPLKDYGPTARTGDELMTQLEQVYKDNYEADKALLVD